MISSGYNFIFGSRAVLGMKKYSHEGPFILQTSFNHNLVSQCSYMVMQSFASLYFESSVLFQFEVC